MRRLMWFTAGFAAACAAGVYFRLDNWCLLVGLFCLIGCVSLLFIGNQISRIISVILLGCVIGFGWLWGYHAFYLSDASDCDGETVSITVTATDYSYTPSYGCAFDGNVVLAGKSYGARCYLNTEMDIAPGDVVSGEFRLRYASDGSGKDFSYHQSKGIVLIATQKGEVSVTAGKLRLLDWPALWRNRITNLIESAFPGDTAGFAKALLLGDTADLTYRQNRDFQVSGIRHIVAVSGLHVSILFALIHMVFGGHRVYNTVFGVPLLLVFAALAGFSPSIVRACMMQFLMLLALLADKEYDPPTALAFASLVILAVNPIAITSVSFQLSVGCMIGIFAFSEPLRMYFFSFGDLKKKSKGKSLRAKLIRWFFGSVSVTLSAMVFTTPLCALYFGMVSLVGILSNLLTLWVVSFIFYGIMITCLTSAIWLPAGKFVALVVSWPIRYVLGVSGLLADFPLAAVYTDSIYIVLWLILSYVLLAAFFLLKKKCPGITAAGIALLLLVCVSLSWLEPALDATRVSVINVGQGQSVLLHRGKERYLVDCGGDHAGMTADTVANYLLSQGIFRLDGIILTHYDADHAGSVLNLLTTVKADKLYIPDFYDSNGLREQIESAYCDQVILIRDTTELELSSGNITLYPGKLQADDNENSVCVLFQSENCDILITGDRSAAGERQLLRQVQLPQLELLIAGHHGSHLATSFDLLFATAPQAVAISVGEDNLYGHPKPEVLERLSRFGCDIYRTDLQGTIVFRR